MKVEFAHDILARKVYEKASTDDKMRLKVERLIKDRYQYYVEGKILLHKDDLEYIHPFVDVISLTPELEEFLDKSEKAEKWRQLRLLIGVLAIAFLILVFAIIMSRYAMQLNIQKNKVANQERISRSLFLLSEARQKYETDESDVAFRLAEAAYDLNPEKKNLVDDLLYKIQQNPLKLELTQKNIITTSSYSTDGKYLVTGAVDGIVNIWSSQGELHHVVKHNDEIVSAQFFNDSKKILTASKDSTIIIWDTVGQPNLILLHNEEISNVTLSPDNEKIFVAYKNKNGRVWSHRGKIIKEIKTFKPIITTGFSKDSDYLLLRSAGSSTVEIWDSKSDQTINLKHPSFAIDAEFSPTKNEVVTLSKDGVIRIWNLNGVEKLHFIHQRAYDLTISPNGENILVASTDGVVSVWDNEGNQISEVEQSGEINHMAFSPDNKTFAVTSDDRKLTFWHTQGYAIDEFYKERLTDVLTFSPDGKMLLTTAFDNTAKIWSVQENLLKTLNHKDKTNLDYNKFTVSSKYILSPSENNSAKLWSISGSKLAEFQHTGRVNSAILNTNQNEVLTASQDNFAVLWDTSGKEIQRFKHTSSVQSATFSSSNKYIVTACQDGQIYIWEKSNGKVIRSVKVSKFGLNQAFFSPNGRTIAVIYSDTLRLVSAGGSIGKAISDGTTILTAQFAESSDSLLVVSRSNAAKMWDTNGKMLRQYRHSKPLNSAIISSNGEYILTAANDGKAKVWNRSGELEMPYEHNYSVKSATFSPNLKRIITTTSEGQVYIWNMDGSMELSLYHERAQKGYFLADGEQAISMSPTQIRYWTKITPEEIIKDYNNITRPLSSLERKFYRIE